MRPTYTKKYIIQEAEFCAEETNKFYNCKLPNEHPKTEQLRNAVLLKRLEFKHYYSKE